MKTLFNHPLAIYLVAGIACMAIMIIVDYILGAEAEHLNAWVIVNRLFGNDIGIADSLAIRKLGLLGAFFVMVLVNTFLGAVLIQLVRLTINLFKA
ncbi:hypothetical protein PY092_11805 [Muricauda sp. 334s03]|uniref:Uncharacterized protein n=1 Tax=Flagellimonas yonaguniensis TaxID=3031325 RepID=A0ABT5Y072_9FLAO|nr:hypothetical protein [[Muricauda] yonaguniensis]MDF0716837.1 hypothetical protein [[Muricauda] yonaguniensis]